MTGVQTCALPISYEGFQNEAAVRELLLAQQLNPNTGHADLAAMYGHMGLENSASRELQRASEIDPTSRANNDLTLNLYFLAGRSDEYLVLYQKLDPGKPIPTWCLTAKANWKMLKRGSTTLLGNTPMS